MDRIVSTIERGIRGAKVQLIRDSGGGGTRILAFKFRGKQRSER